MLNKPIDVAQVKAGCSLALRELENHLCEQRIRGLQWLTGDHATIADVACFAYTALSPDAGIEHDDYPAIRSWLYAIRCLPGFITMPGIYELHGLRNPRGVEAEGVETKGVKAEGKALKAKDTGTLQ